MGGKTFNVPGPTYDIYFRFYISGFIFHEMGIRHSMSKGLRHSMSYTYGQGCLEFRGKNCYWNYLLDTLLQILFKLFLSFCISTLFSMVYNAKKSVDKFRYFNYNIYILKMRNRQWFMDQNKTLSITKENTMKINKKNLIERIEYIQDGNLVDDAFNSIELAILLDTSWDEYVEAVGEDNTRYLWNLLTQYAIQCNTEEYPELWKVKEFSWYGDNLSPAEAAVEWLQAEEAKAHRDTLKSL